MWRKTKDNNEGNCHLLALEKYGEERGITMKVTVVYWHYRKVWRRTRDNNEGNCRLLTLEKYGEERGITMKVSAVYWH